MPRATNKVHARSGSVWFPFQSLCGTAGETGVHPDVISCLRCMYLSGQYMPLAKLREHQSELSFGRAQYGYRDPFYAAVVEPRCAGCGVPLVKIGKAWRCPIPEMCAV